MSVWIVQGGEYEQTYIAAAFDNEAAAVAYADTRADYWVAGEVEVMSSAQGWLDLDASRQAEYEASRPAPIPLDQQPSVPIPPPPPKPEPSPLAALEGWS